MLWLLLTIVWALANAVLGMGQHARMVKHHEKYSAQVSSDVVSSLKPTATKKLGARSVPQSTLSPTSLFIPSLPGDESANDPTSVYYYGEGFISYTSVYALITGRPSKDGGLKTNYMYQGPTEIKIPHVMRTAVVGDKTLSGLFDVDCSVKTGKNSGWQCQYGYETSGATSSYSVVPTNTQPNTFITPIVGKLDQAQKQSADGISDVPSFSDGKVVHVHPSNRAQRLTSIFSTLPSSFTIPCVLFSAALVALCAMVL